MTDTDQLPFEVDDAIVLVLGAPSRIPSLQDRIEGITRLEKLVFLVERESELRDLITEDADFRSHNFGPFSSKVYQAVDTLVAAGLVEDSASLSSTSEDAWETERVIGAEASDPYATRNLSLTARGRRYYEALITELPKDVGPMLAEFKDQFGALPLRQLIRYVYQRYPEYTEKSIIRDQILGG
ncbi:MAG: hypothetical protein QOI95_4440 [Acidimicrobiaceae bacterium]|jgi:hypothetical protein